MPKGEGEPVDTNNGAGTTTKLRPEGRTILSGTEVFRPRRRKFADDVTEMMRQVPRGARAYPLRRRGA